MAERCPWCGKFRKEWARMSQTQWDAMTNGPEYICIPCDEKRLRREERFAQGATIQAIGEER